MGPRNSPLDPLEACLWRTLDERVEVQLGDEREVYAYILDMASLFFPLTPSKWDSQFAGEAIQGRKEVLSQGEIKAIAFHLRYEFLGTNETFSVTVNASLDGT